MRADEPADPDDIMWMGRFALALHGFDKPMICAINRVAAGGAMALALGADMQVGSEKTCFKMVFAERALGPDCGVSFFLPRIVGYSRAADFLMTWRMVEADEAHKIGLIDRLVPHASLIDETLALAVQIADGPPRALRVRKRVLQAGCGLQPASRRAGRSGRLDQGAGSAWGSGRSEARVRRKA